MPRRRISCLEVAYSFSVFSMARYISCIHAVGGELAVLFGDVVLEQFEE